ncbi:MAG: hypothetical protein Q7K44_01205 [Candidatus Liptonbacteria bacterium]|nr:hypothetical protein [Candidatus Liptonbacteria bacterium]
MSTFFGFLSFIALVLLVIGLIKPTILKLQSRKGVFYIFGAIFLVLFVATLTISSPQSSRTISSNSNQSVEEFFRNPETSLLTIGDLDLQTSDVWNKNLGYYVYLAPPQTKSIPNSQVEAVLKEIGAFKNFHKDKWFYIMIFDDPAIARTDRVSIGKNLDVPEGTWCKETFSHYRGAYSWNPTNQFEQMNVNQNCNWVSILNRTTNVIDEPVNFDSVKDFAPGPMAKYPNAIYKIEQWKADGIHSILILQNSYDDITVYLDEKVQTVGTYRSKRDCGNDVCYDFAGKKILFFKTPVKDSTVKFVGKPE